jgi:hypothetical protein
MFGWMLEHAGQTGERQHAQRSKLLHALLLLSAAAHQGPCHLPAQRLRCPAASPQTGTQTQTCIANRVDQHSSSMSCQCPSLQMQAVACWAGNTCARVA